MTDEQIVNALRLCADYGCYRCTEYGKEHCRYTVASLAWDLIHRQKAEIERLKNENFCLGNERDALLGVMDTAVSEAVKEFSKFLLDNKVDVVDLTAEYLKQC